MLDAKAIVTKLKADNFRELRGARINAVIPLTENLLNEIVTRQARQSGVVEEMAIRLPGGNRLVLFVKARVPTKVFGIKIPVKKAIEMEVAHQVPLQPSPRLQLRIVEGLSGLEKTLISLLENIISRSVPGEISMQDDRLTIDFGALLRKKGLDFTAEMIEEVNIDGEAGKLIVSASLRI